MPTVNGTEQQLSALDSSVLHSLAESATGLAPITLDGWRYSRVSGGLGGDIGGTAVYRFTGQCCYREVSRDWSLILKILHAREGEATISSHYWRREADAYTCGLLADIPGNLLAPCCFGVMEQADSCWLWLEDIQDDAPGRWSIARHALVARQLGELNGAYMVDRLLPQRNWLSRDWIRQDVNRFGHLVMQLQPYRHHSLMGRWLSDTAVEQMQRLWAERDRFLVALDKLPQTLCHMDAFRRNLFIRQGQVVAIDWSFVGIGPVGADLVAPFWVNYVFEEASPHETHELDAALFEHYVDGLRSAGWKGDPRQARLGYIAAMGLRWLAGIGINAPQVAQRLQDGETVSESFIDSVSVAGAYIARLADEARKLILQLSP